MNEGAALARFGAHLRSLRKSKGLSQEALGLTCGLSQTYVSEIENGQRNPSLLSLLAISHALDMTLPQLLDGIQWPED